LGKYLFDSLRVQLTQPRTYKQRTIKNRGRTIVEKGDTGMLDKDPAYPIVQAIVAVVPASRWSFARIDADGNFGSPIASDGETADMTLLQREFRRQRKLVRNGPRIAATIVAANADESGLTLIFADSRADFGIFVLARQASSGLFTSTEVAMLTFALDTVSERFAVLRRPARMFEYRPMAPLEPPATAWYVLDREFAIVLAWRSEEERRLAMSGLQTRLAERLPVVLEESVRELTAAWDREFTPAAATARPVPFLLVRAQPMSGPAGHFIGVRIDRFQAPSSLSEAAARFHITQREMQVLALMLDGQHLDEIGRVLSITSSTVQDHIKNMVTKTGSRNRSELIAHVLGWEATPGEARA
jgi:DNA-binding CsgD family transcriptional regulator